MRLKLAMNKDTKIPNWLLPAIAIFLVAIVPRIWNLSGNSVFIDEIWWMERGRYLIHNLLDFNLINLQKGWWQFNNTVALGLPAAFLIGLFQKLFIHLHVEVASRLPLAILGALSPVTLYLFVRKAGFHKVAILAGMLLALDPVHIGLSRWAHQDMILSLFFMLALFGYYFWVKEKKIVWLTCAVVGLTLAFLTKFSALIIIAILLFWKIADLIFSKKFKIPDFKNYFNRFDLIFLISTFILVMIFWPGDWTSNPFKTFFQYFFKQLGVDATFDHTNFYLGEIIKNPAWHYYLVILGIRLTELSIIGFFLGLFLILKNYKKEFRFWSLMIIWILITLVVMSIAKKKLEVRYVLPLYPALLTVAAYGILKAIQKIVSYFKAWRNLKNLALYLSIVLIFAFYLPILFYVAPDYYLYYNHIAGGTKGALRYSAVGVNEGLKGAALYVKEHYSKKTPLLLVGHRQPFLFYYKPDYLTGNLAHLDQVRVAMIESHQIQRIGEPVVERLEKWGKLVHRVTLSGADLVLIYEKK